MYKFFYVFLSFMSLFSTIVMNKDEYNKLFWPFFHVMIWELRCRLLVMARE